MDIHLAQYALRMLTQKDKFEHRPHPNAVVHFYPGHARAKKETFSVEHSTEARGPLEIRELRDLYLLKLPKGLTIIRVNSPHWSKNFSYAMGDLNMVCTKDTWRQNTVDMLGAMIAVRYFDTKRGCMEICQRYKQCLLQKEPEPEKPEDRKRPRKTTKEGEEEEEEE